MHMHTPLCKHAVGSPEEYAAVAQKRGLKGIVVTCHNPTNDGWSPTTRMSEAEFDQYVELVARARTTWSGRIDIRLGMESDFVPGMETWLTDLHSRAEFHHVLGSVHPHLPEYRQKYFAGDYVQYQCTYFEHLAIAAETGLFDTLAHPDLVKNVEPSEWQLDRIIDQVCQYLDRIAATNTAMELNTSGLNKNIAEMNPSTAILVEMHKRDIPVVVGADAHKPERVGDRFRDALEILRDIGYTDTSFFLNRERQDHPIDDVLSTIVSGDS